MGTLALPFPIRWTTRFVATDASQPVRTMLLILSALRKNQWVLLHWQQLKDLPKRFFPLQKSEIEPSLSDIRPEISVADALRFTTLEGSAAVTAERDKVFVGEINQEFPWLSRKVMVNPKGEPVAIGVVRELRPVKRSDWRGASVSHLEPSEADREILYSLEEPLMSKTAAEAALVEPPLQVPRDYTIVKVFYATDRKEAAKGKPYLGQRCEDGILRFGTCEVSIPRDHRMANLEAPKWWRFEFKSNPSKHIALLDNSALPKDQFFNHLKSEIKDCSSHDCFVFIHGFKVSFEDGARRTAQLAYDLGFKGVPILYSWPSAGKLKGYLTDEATIEWTRPHLEEFLKDIAVKARASIVHIVAHSMGNRALLKMLERLHLAKAEEPKFQQVVLTAPDIDASEFVQLAAELGEHASRITLYASSNDKAIQLSKKVHTYARAGDAGSNIIVVKGIDTIDATSVDTSLMGHSYYGDRRTVLSDLFYLIQDGRPPDKRHGLESRSCSGGAYWAFKP